MFIRRVTDHNCPSHLQCSPISEVSASSIRLKSNLTRKTNE